MAVFCRSSRDNVAYITVIYMFCCCCNSIITKYLFILPSEWVQVAAHWCQVIQVQPQAVRNSQRSRLGLGVFVHQHIYYPRMTHHPINHPFQMFLRSVYERLNHALRLDLKISRTWNENQGSWIQDSNPYVTAGVDASLAVFWIFRCVHGFKLVIVGCNECGTAIQLIRYRPWRGLLMTSLYKARFAGPPRFWARERLCHVNTTFDRRSWIRTIDIA